MKEPLTKIAGDLVKAGSGNIDFVAFGFSAVLGLVAGGAAQSFGWFAGVTAFLSGVWIAMRYALFRVQSAERLRQIRDGSSERARVTLRRRVSMQEADFIFGKDDPDDGNSER